MITIGLFAIIKRNYGLIMDADKNPLFALPPAQRFQTMVYLSVMWTAIFCGSLGAWRLALVWRASYRPRPVCSRRIDHRPEISGGGKRSYAEI